MRRLQRHRGDHAVARVADTPLWSVADKDITTIEGWEARNSRIRCSVRYRRASPAVRLLRFRHLDERRDILMQNPKSRQQRT